ncbi:alpha/beta hydrolase [Porphyromonadaceae sp. NP-X]|jgi:acetyl esterase/lipase|nr:alpha/beta hydrolase [Porphyromonadaceae sp. NP-X]NLJ20700.1 alpha/beta hydrolase [Bacteroidales bacterium]
MIKTFSVLLFSLIGILIVNAADYQFQEGFSITTPDGWIRLCSSTSSLNHTGLTFSGSYAAKFDAAGSGRYNKNLISPQIVGADTLSFYVSKNANATYMTLYVGKVIGNDTTILQTYDAFTFPNKSSNPGFSKIILPIKDAGTFKIIFYAIASTDPNYVNAGWFVVDDIELTKYTGSMNPPVEQAIDKIQTDFGDGTWGTIATTPYSSGSYPSSILNGFNLVRSYLYTGSVTCVTGEKHVNRILLDKSSLGAAVEFPALNTVGELEIHAATGTDAMSFRLEEQVNSEWQVLGTYTTRKTPDSIYVIPLLRNSTTKLRIANNTGSGLYIYKIVSRTYQEATELTLRSSSPSEGEVVYSNLKKNIMLTFNRNISIGTGTILLNGVSILLKNCQIVNNVVSIPVTFTTTPGVNKVYTLIVSAGSFVEVGNATNQSKMITVHFETLKSVAYPSSYNGLTDVVYKNVNSENTRMDIYYPLNPKAPVPVVINMHGGGWNHGYKEDQGGFNLYFNRSYAVANVEYRMTGEATAPAAVEDVRGAMMYLLNHAKELNIDPMKIIFQGGSAGGHLALISGYLGNNPLFDNDCVLYGGNYKIMAVIDKYGPADLNNFMFYTSLVNWLGTHASDQDFINSISPIHYVDLYTPPTYIIHGDADPTVPYSQSVTLHNSLDAAGVKNQFTTVPGGGHGGFSDTYNTQMENEITAFLTEVENNSTNGVKNIDRNKNTFFSISGRNIVIHIEAKTWTNVYDFIGKNIIRTDDKNIALPDKGIYLLTVEKENEKFVSKLIVK